MLLLWHVIKATNKLPNSLIVMDNAPYHNQHLSKVTGVSSRNSIFRRNLQEKGATKIVRIFNLTAEP